MPLRPVAEMLEHARQHRYAIGYFESWDLASLEGVIDAAEETHAPVIVGFNGEFLAQPDRGAPVRLEWYGALGRAAAESARVPCAVMFNECPWDAWVEHATRAGFNLVMLADETAEQADLTPRIARLVDLAHGRGVAVEAELGTLPCGASSDTAEQKSLTDPELAAAFVAETGVDLLAVSVGNIHILLDGQKELNLAHLAALRRKLQIPLVLHGGTGIAGDSLTEAIALGIAKVNYGTYLKQRTLAAIRQVLASAEANPHRLLGDGSRCDLTVLTRHAVRDAVLERIGLLGCCGQA